MNIATIAVLAAVVIAVFFAVLSWRRHGSGSCGGCGGNCANCAKKCRERE